MPRQAILKIKDAEDKTQAVLHDAENSAKEIIKDAHMRVEESKRIFEGEVFAKIKEINLGADKKISEIVSESDNKIENLKNEIKKTTLDSKQSVIENIVKAICNGEGVTE